MSPVDTNNRPAPKKTKNFIGFAAVTDKTSGKLGQFFIFPNYQAGREQLELCVRRLYATKTLPQLVAKYAPHESNDTSKYTADLLRETDIGSERTVSELTDGELNRVLDAIEKIEGYHGNVDSRREVWVPVSHITATDGAKPLSDEEIVLRVKGNDTVVKTNKFGQVPAIAHRNGEQIEVLHKQASGELRSVGAIQGNSGQHYSLQTWVLRAFGVPGPDIAPSPASARRAAMAYTVQPGDTLSKLAARFEATSEQIKRDNGLRNDVIFAGQQLGIYGALSPVAGALRPLVKQAVPRADPAVKGKQAPPANEAATPARSKAGIGKPIATVRADQRMAPWMTVAFREATTYAGEKEKEITKTHNYHRLVTQNDRAGGRTVELKDKKGVPLLGKDGKPQTMTKFDGLSTLAGDHNPWCASFVNYCLREAGYAPGRRHMSSYTFGEDKDLFIRVKAPVYGAVRFSHREGGGHVCFVYGTAADKLVVIGGNQGDQICFELMEPVSKGTMFFVPITYKDYSEKDGATLPDIDIEALKKEFGDAVNIDATQLHSKHLPNRSQS